MSFDAQLLAEVDAYVDAVWDDVMSDIALLVSHPSVADYEAAEPGAPYGPEAHAALICALGIAERLGLQSHDCEGHIGYADLPGASERQIATIAHVDVVPAGFGWTQDPFTVVERDGYILGRGVLDDKGPAILSLYAAHYFARKGETLPYTLRCLLGSDEEVGMTDVGYYLEHHDQPAFLFTPDAEFPVCVGEKGHYCASIISGQIENGAIVELDAGTVSNAIPGIAEVVIRAKAEDLPGAEGIDVVQDGDDCARLIAHGKGGHASLPAGTTNAIGMLVDYLLSNGLLSDSERPYFELLSHVYASTDGSTLGIAASDEYFEPLTCIGGTLRLRDGVFTQTVDSRYPTTITGAEITLRLTELAERYGATVIQKDDAVPYLTDPSSAPVQALIDCYNEVTGKNAKPFTIGGGTYARNFAHAVSFGPEEMDATMPAWVGSMHGPDEGVSIELLRKCLKIYILALGRLMELDL